MGLMAEVSSLIQREAQLLDGNRYSEWLDLYTSDAIYQIPPGYPSAPDDTEGLQTILLDRRKLEDYAHRMSSGHAVVSHPPPRTVRLVSSPLACGESLFSVAWNLHLVRNDESSLFSGRTVYEIATEADRMKIRRKVVNVANDSFSSGYMPLI